MGAAWCLLQGLLRASDEPMSIHTHPTDIYIHTPHITHTIPHTPHIHCYHILTVVNSVAMYTGVQIFL